MKYISKDEFMQMYHVDKLSKADIADVIGVGVVTVNRLMKEYGIVIRTCSEAKLLHASKPSCECLNKMYWDDNLSQSEIAELIGVHTGTIAKWMKMYDIEVRTKSKRLTGKYTGENACNWRGGISFEPYCYKFNDEFKEAVCLRDDYICQLCGYEQKMGGQRLSVHHIHYDKSNCYPDVVALCRICNGRVNGNRDYWENFFMSQLAERGMLNWKI